MKRNCLTFALTVLLMLCITGCQNAATSGEQENSSSQIQSEEAPSAETVKDYGPATKGALPGDGERPIKTDSNSEYEFEVYSAGTVITSYIGDREVTELTIPEELGGKPVVKLGTLSMENIDQMECVILPDSLLEIGTHAFSSCDSLSEIQFSSNLKTIGEMAFWYCKSLQYPVLPDSLETIRNGAFDHSGVVELIIPEQVNEMGTSICSSCYALEYAEFLNHPDRMPESMFNLCESLLNVEGLDHVTVVDKQAFFGCEALNGIELPEGLERIEESAFSCCTALDDLLLPSTLRYIGDSAFFANGFYTVTIPAGVETVDEFAFNYNSNLESVTIEGASTVIKQGAFSRNNLTACYMPSTTSFDELAFDWDTEIVYTD